MNSQLILSVSALICSVVFLKSFQFFFLKNNMIDEIKIRSSHKTIATRSGGIAIFISIFFVSLFYYISSNVIYDFSFLVPLSLLLFIGLYDDIYKLDFKLKFIFQIIAAKIIIDNGLIIDNLHGVFGIYELNRIIGQLITIFFIVAIINAINFIDGIDGLAISSVALFIILFELLSSMNSIFINFSIIVVSTFLPLYYFNFKKKNKIFLGDSGSLFLGGVVSIYVLHILSQNYIIKDAFDIHKILFVISVLFYPIIDIIRVVILRIYNNKSPFIADKNHIHHLLNQKTENHFFSVLIIIATSIIVFSSIHLIL